jgi:CBS domain-containing protein
MPSKVNVKIIDRMFHLRNKLISHIDIDLEKVITERDIRNLIKLYDGYVVKKVDRIMVKFLGNSQSGSLDFEDMSVRTYVLLFPRESSTWIPEAKRRS